MLNGETETEEHVAKARTLTGKLQIAAYAGCIKFRALKNGDNHADGHKDIDHLYFSEERGFRWDLDQIWVRDVSPQHPQFVPQRAFRMDWHDVHLDREGFEALMRSMGVSVQQRSDAYVPGNQKIFKTGVAGRPSSIKLVLPVARSRLTAGDYPDTQTKFSEQLAEHLAKAEPEAPRLTAKAIRNNPEFRELWRLRAPKIIDRS
jgi:hypothetical protein